MQEVGIWNARHVIRRRGRWLAKKSKFDEWSKIYFLTCFLSQIWSQCRRFCFRRFLLHGIWGTGSNRAKEFSHISCHFGLHCTRGSFLSVFVLNIFIIFRFLVLNTVEVSDQPFRVILKSYPFYAKWLQMRKASKGFVLLPASLSNVLHVAMFNLSTDTWERTIRNCNIGISPSS